MLGSGDTAARAPFGIVVMGVCGTGKSTLARALAVARTSPFLEGDECHPDANIERMRAGIPLQDDDRWPWLKLIAARMAALIDRHGEAIVTCSALKRTYRDCLRVSLPFVIRFVCLEADRPLLSARLTHRQDHYMPVTLLDSQLQAYERPTFEQDCLCLDAGQPLPFLLKQASAWLQQSDGSVKCDQR